MPTKRYPALSAYAPVGTFANGALASQYCVTDITLVGGNTCLSTPDTSSYLWAHPVHLAESQNGHNSTVGAEVYFGNVDLSNAEHIIVRGITRASTTSAAVISTGKLAEISLSAYTGGPTSIGGSQFEQSLSGGMGASSYGTEWNQSYTSLFAATNHSYTFPDWVASRGGGGVSYFFNSATEGLYVQLAYAWTNGSNYPSSICYLELIVKERGGTYDRAPNKKDDPYLGYVFFENNVVLLNSDLSFSSLRGFDCDLTPRWNVIANGSVVNMMSLRTFQAFSLAEDGGLTGAFMPDWFHQSGQPYAVTANQEDKTLILVGENYVPEINDYTNFVAQVTPDLSRIVSWFQTVEGTINAAYGSTYANIGCFIHKGVYYFLPNPSPGMGIFQGGSTVLGRIDMATGNDLGPIDLTQFFPQSTLDYWGGSLYAYGMCFDPVTQSIWVMTNWDGSGVPDYGIPGGYNVPGGGYPFAATFLNLSLDWTVLSRTCFYSAYPNGDSPFVNSEGLLEISADGQTLYWYWSGGSQQVANTGAPNGNEYDGLWAMPVSQLKSAPFQNYWDYYNPVLLEPAGWASGYPGIPLQPIRGTSVAPPLRFRQRDDGLGRDTGHAHINTRAGRVSSVQFQNSPRIGGNGLAHGGQNYV